MFNYAFLSRGMLVLTNTSILSLTRTLTLCVRVVEALTRMSGRAGSSEPSLLSGMISTCAHYLTIIMMTMLPFYNRTEQNISFIDIKLRPLTGNVRAKPKLAIRYASG